MWFGMARNSNRIAKPLPPSFSKLNAAVLFINTHYGSSP
jgi:hypothetical protein